MTFNQAKKLQAGDYIHTPKYLNADNTPERYKVTSLKLWKRSPDKIRIRAKRGLYEHIELNIDIKYYPVICKAQLSQFKLGYGS